MAENPAAIFADMAARIERNAAEEFAGAIVVVPPGDGEPITFLGVDPNPDLAQFWASIETRITIRKNDALAAAEPRWGQR